MIYVHDFSIPRYISHVVDISVSVRYRIMFNYTEIPYVTYMIYASLLYSITTLDSGRC
jgi:hypothetical protein